MNCCTPSTRPRFRSPRTCRVCPAWPARWPRPDWASTIGWRWAFPIIGRGLSGEQRDEDWRSGRHLRHPAQPQAQRKAHRVRRVARPGACGRQDARVSINGSGDVYGHGAEGAEPRRAARRGPAQIDPAIDVRPGRRGLAEFHGQRVRPSRNGSTFPARATTILSIMRGGSGIWPTGPICATPT